jgi:hypothetical protein
MNKGIFLSTHSYDDFLVLRALLQTSYVRMCGKECRVFDKSTDTILYSAPKRICNAVRPFPGNVVCEEEVVTLVDHEVVGAPMWRLARLHSISLPMVTRVLHDQLHGQLCNRRCIRGVEKRSVNGYCSGI